jgi:membrane protein
LNLGGLGVRELLLRTWNKVNDNEIMTRAAAVSFYAMLALVPFLALILTLIVQLLPDVTGLTGAKGIGDLTAAELDRTLKQSFPVEAYRVVHDQIVHLQRQKQPPLGLLLVGLGVTVWLASSLFVAIIDAMNRICGVTESRSLVKIRLVAIAMTCVQAVILVGSLLAIVLWPQIVAWVGLSAPAVAVATVVQWAVVVVVVLLSFALSLYVAPDADQRWEWITPGSLLGTAVFLTSSFGFRLYVQHFANYDKTYGSLGGVMVLLFWFWISSLVLLSAAQMNKVIEEASPLGKKHGQKVDPTEAPDLKSLAPEPSPSR